MNPPKATAVSKSGNPGPTGLAGLISLTDTLLDYRLSELLLAFFIYACGENENTRYGPND